MEAAIIQNAVVRQTARAGTGREVIAMTFADTELQLNNLGLSLNSELPVTVSFEEEAEDAIIVLEKYFAYDSGSEYVRIVWSDAN